LGGKEKKLTNMKDEEWEILDRRALGMVWLCLEALMAFKISKEKTTNDLMKELDKLYEKPLDSNKVFLMKKLFSMKM
jgi:hypothetical protein